MPIFYFKGYLPQESITKSKWSISKCNNKYSNCAGKNDQFNNNSTFHGFVKIGL
jgi:hypothetical protein